MRRLRNKLYDLNEILLQNPYKNVNILLLIETWLYSNEKQFFKIASSAVHNRRSTRGGGTSVYIKTIINFYYYINLEDSYIVSVTLSTLKCTVWSIYRAPNSNIPMFLRDINKIIESEKSNVW